MGLEDQCHSECDVSSQPGFKKRVLDLLASIQPEGLSVNEIRERLGLTTEQQEMGRRMRELVKVGNVDRIHEGGATKYVFKRALSETRAVRAPGVTKTQRARILWRAQNRCEMCGRSVTEDHVKLHIDHKIPQAWGGTSEDDNLWALCSTCNEGKRDFFATITDERVQRAMTDPRVHVRLGELLKSFAGEPVPAKYLELVAYTHDDWQKRLRELRAIGWRFHATRHTDETGRVRASYILDHWEPWPDDPVAAIREAERRTGSQR